MYIDRRKPLHEDAFFFTRGTLFPPQDKRNTRDKVKGLRISSERYIGELGVRYLSTISSGQDSRQQSQYRSISLPYFTSVCGIEIRLSLQTYESLAAGGV